MLNISKYLLATTLLLGGTAAAQEVDVNVRVTPPPAVVVPLPRPRPAVVELPPVDVQPQPLGWVYGRYLRCDDDVCVVSLGADGLNVRHTPNGRPFMALVNGITVLPLQESGRWLLIAPGCNLVPTGIWSDTHGVQLYRCGR